MNYKNIISNARLMVLMVAFLVVSGISAYTTLPRAEDPVIIQRNATIATHYHGATSIRVESLVTEVIENKLRELNEISTITSTSRAGISLVKIELNESIVAPDLVWSLIRDKLSDIEPDLPEGSLSPVLDTDFGSFTTIYSLGWQGSEKPDLLILGRYAKELAKRLRTISGTEFVDEFGLPEEEIVVHVNSDDAFAAGLSVSKLANAIDGADVKGSAGELVSHDSRFGLEISSQLNSVERIAKVPITVDKNGFSVRVGDVATVSRSAKTPYDELALVDGQPKVIVAARMQSNQRIDKWTSDAFETLEAFQEALPANINAHVIFTQQPYTEDRLFELGKSLLIGLAIVLIVLLFSLGFRAAFIVALALPLTMMFTLTLMKFFAVPIDQMSVTGFIVALGIMVDNAIVMVDTIQAFRLKGKAKIESAMLAIRHLWVPLASATLTTVLAFAPIFLMPGATGEFVGSIALTVSFALIGSYIISHTIIASLSSFLLSDNQARTVWYKRGVRIPMLSRAFSKLVLVAVRHSYLAIFLVVSIPLFGFWSSTQLTQQFFPTSDRDMFEIQIYLPPQSNIYATKATTEKVHDLIEEELGIKQVSWLIGTAFPSFYYNVIPPEQNAPFFAHGMVRATDFMAANRLIPHLQSKLDKAVPEAQILVRKLEQGPPFSAPIELRVYGNDIDTLKNIGKDIRLMLSEVSHVTHTRETLTQGIPQYTLNVDEEAVQMNGLSLTNFANKLKSSLTGQQKASVMEGPEAIPVRVRISEDDVQSYSDLNKLRFSVDIQGRNEGFAVMDLSTLELVSGSGSITHRNGYRVNTIEGYIEANVLTQTALDDFKTKLESYRFPPGYQFEFGGETEERNDSVDNLLGNISVVVVLMILLVVLSFNSFRLSAVIFTVAGLSTGLGFLSVWLFGYPFGFTVIIALLGVMGLAINAAIVIISELRACPEASQGDEAAIVRGVMNCTRHITSTTITTIGGFVPLILAGGGLWPPFAVTIAGGTALTTVISFFFVPSIFKLLTKSSAKIKSFKGAISPT